MEQTEKPRRPPGPCARCKRNLKMAGAGYCRRCKSAWDNERRNFFRQRVIDLEKENEVLRARVAEYESRIILKL